MKKFLLILLALVMCIFMCACGSIFKPGYEKAVQRVIDVGFYRNRNEETLLTVAPENFWQWWADEEGYDNIDEFFAEVELRASDPIDLENVKNKKVNYEIKYLAELSEEECSRVEKALEKHHDLNYDEITEAYSFQLDFEITDSDGEVKEESCDVVAVKMDGEWYIAIYNDYRIMWLIDKFM